MRMAMHIALMGGNNIKMYLKEIGWEGVGWIHEARDRVQWQPFVNGN
jgi:hypothetical protein